MADARQETHAHLIGGGIASLASAAFLIRDGRVSEMNIHILEETDRLGGSLDAQGSREKGYILRGGRMFDEEAYTCTYDLLSSIPSIRNPSLSVKADMDAFNEQVTSHSHARLIDSDGNKVDVTSPGFSHRDRADLVKLLALPEEVIGARRITDYFAPSFFKTNFWYLWATTFAFQPWHSAIELKRYLQRFIHEFPQIDTLAGVRRTPYNQYDAIVRPLTAWLQERGVRFEMGTQVTDLNFRQRGRTRSVRTHSLHAWWNARVGRRPRARLRLRHPRLHDGGLQPRLDDNGAPPRGDQVGRLLNALGTHRAQAARFREPVRLR